MAGDHRVRAKRFVVATGSSPLVPDVPGLDEVSYFTNETIFDNTERPAHLIVIGGGPIAMELAQAHCRLGARVSVLQRSTIMRADDPELVDVVRRRVRAEGVELYEGLEIVRVERDRNGVAAVILHDGAETRICGSHLLVAVGRSANVGSLGLDRAGIDHDAKGIRVDARLRTSNRRVFAIGDVTGGH